jgi:hypothetical protein
VKHEFDTVKKIFQLQTAAFRADLDDFEWEFVQGTVRHTEGNWSLYTTAFSKLPLYTYYNPLSPASILQTETELEELIAREGPFDCVLGYSGGAALAAEIIIRDAVANPFSLPEERPFRFAIFINGASPLRVFRLADEELSDIEFDPSALLNEAQSMFMRPSALRHKEGVSPEDQADHAAMIALLNSCEGKMLADGTAFISSGEFGLCRFEPGEDDEPLIDIPTLHLRSLEEDEVDPHHGLHLLSLCNKANVREFHHAHGHDFPRGRVEMKKIAQLIRDVAEDAWKL